MAQASPASKRSNLFEFALIFLVVYVGVQLVTRMFFPQAQTGVPGAGAVTLAVGNVTTGNNATVTVTNATQSDLEIASRCPLPPVDIYFVEGAEGSQKLTNVTSSGTAVDCVAPVAKIVSGGSAQLPLAAWKYSSFSKVGTYEVRLPVTVATKSATGAGVVQGQPSARFQIADPGMFTKLFRTFISKPFLNFLIFVASLLPDHNLGIAIIVLTIVVKLLLYIPTQHSLEGQKKMQMLQPKLDELKRKYPNDPKKQQEETMQLWKEHGVNPFQSCLPLLVQFPVLIGLLYVIRDQSTLELSRHLIYPFYRHLTWHFGTSFLGLDLLKPEYFILPPLLVILQFLQMKLAFTISARKKAKKDIIDVPSKKDGKGEEKKESSAAETQQKIMVYVLPLMIGFFAIKFPAAVSIYWGVSTLFGIGQQIVVNREHIKP